MGGRSFQDEGHWHDRSGVDIDIVTADPLQDIQNMRKLDTVIKDGKIVDREYHPWYKGWLFANATMKVAPWSKTMPGSRREAGDMASQCGPAISISGAAAPFNGSRSVGIADTAIESLAAHAHSGQHQELESKASTL
jgi:hypothetical protein